MSAELQRLVIEQQMDDLGYVPRITAISLEAAGLEEDTNQQPMFGNTDNGLQTDDCKGRCEGGVVETVMWFSDGEDSRYEMN